MTIQAACGTLSWTTTEYLPPPPWRVKLAGLAVLHVHSNENERSNNRSYESACLSLESVDFAFKLPLDGSPRTWTVFNSPESQNCSTWGLVARADDWQICPSGTLSTYWRSQSQHVKLRNYKCYQCGYGSSQKGDPRKHVKIHSDHPTSRTSQHKKLTATSRETYHWNFKFSTLLVYDLEPEVLIKLSIQWPSLCYRKIFLLALPYKD